jgi:uncharacterized coiled-coil DUF342 family protein
VSQQSRRLGATLAATCAIGVAVGLYFKTQPVSAEQHTRIVDSFGRLHTLNAKIAQETLAARHGLAPTYDPLTQSAREFSEEAFELARELTSVHPDLAPVLDELREQMTQRGQAIEHFKTQNSVLKNSL